MIDYRKLRPSNLNSPQFRHLLMLLYWPLFGITFMIQERFLTLDYNIMYTAFDDKIPFFEYFVIPYLFWFVFLVGIHIYTLLFDAPAFKKLMRFIMITYTITAIIYFVYPTMQELRPVEFARDNIFTRFMQGFYKFDTNTNVCPSLHVIGSVAVLFTSWHIDRFKTWPWRITFMVITILISMSTVFLKQHSILDVPPAIIICAIAYPFAYKWKVKDKKAEVVHN